MPKVKKSKVKRACPLEKQLAYDESKQFASTKTSKNSRNPMKNDSDDEMDAYVPEKLSKRTLQLAKEQQQEEEAAAAAASKRFNSSIEEENDLGSDDEDMDMDGEYDDGNGDGLIRIEDGYVEDVEISEADQQALASFMNPGLQEKRNLADIIMEKIREKEERERALASGESLDAAAAPGPTFDPKVVEVYQGVGKILKRYTSGKLPKAFKVIPSLTAWEEIVWLTNPESWSTHAMRAATRLFASNLNPKMAQRFYNIFLLEHVRQDIRENKRLNYHLYMALKKALYKPQAFFKGIVIPLCEGGDCTLREAAIIGSSLVKVSIPVIHSAAALFKLSELPYSGGTCIFIRVLLNKKYNLPTRVVTHLSSYFLRFIKEERKLPVLWHQSLLVFVQRYKNAIPAADKEKMKTLIKTHFHYQISPEIRRELFG